MKIKNYLFFVCLIVVFVFGCQKEDQVKPDATTTSTTATTSTTNTTSATGYNPTPYFVKLPLGFPAMPVPIDNPLTVEGIDLGRRLFHDPILSKDSSLSCASCHNQANGFTDNGKQFSTGVSGIAGERNAMLIFNLAWVEKYAKTPHRFFWDGGAKDLESQVIAPITNPIEMEENLPHVLLKLQRNSVYPPLFKKAFGTDSITTLLLMRAVAQFERTIVSGNTRADYFLIQQQPTLTAQEARGFEVFNDSLKGDCFHCHNLSGVFMNDFLFHNNGHSGIDKGLGKITGNSEDNGKFRTATLRNLVFTAPYMHDGRFNTLEEVVEFYNSGALRTGLSDPFIAKHPDGLHLSDQDKADLVAFLKSITDSTLITNTFYRGN
jgi:cytochrome c peroxidase